MKLFKTFDDCKDCKVEICYEPCDPDDYNLGYVFRYFYYRIIPSELPWYLRINNGWKKLNFVNSIGEWSDLFTSREYEESNIKSIKTYEDVINYYNKQEELLKINKEKFNKSMGKSYGWDF